MFYIIYQLLARLAVLEKTDEVKLWFHVQQDLYWTDLNQT